MFSLVILTLTDLTLRFEECNISFDDILGDLYIYIKNNSVFQYKIKDIKHLIIMK